MKSANLLQRGRAHLSAEGAPSPIPCLAGPPGAVCERRDFGERREPSPAPICQDCAQRCKPSLRCERLAGASPSCRWSAPVSGTEAPLHCQLPAQHDWTITSARRLHSNDCEAIAQKPKPGGMRTSSPAEWSLISPAPYLRSLRLILDTPAIAMPSIASVKPPSGTGVPPEGGWDQDLSEVRMSRSWRS